MQHKIPVGVREKKDLQMGVRGPKSLVNPVIKCYFHFYLMLVNCHCNLTKLLCTRTKPFE